VKTKAGKGKHTSSICIAWRATDWCEAKGPRLPVLDKKCNVAIDPAGAGYCECKFSKVPANCGHLPATCDDACLNGDFRIVQH
jgi:hypothetical protein